MEKILLFLHLALIAVLHATARTIPAVQTNPNEDHATNPSATTNALAPIHNTGNIATSSAAAAAPGAWAGDQKNFITYGGVGGWSGIGGWGGVLPVFGGLGGIGLGKVGGIGVGGGVGGVGGVGGIIP